MIKKKISSKVKIITAAQKLYLEKGFHATSVREIATAAGVSMGGMYGHFSGKEEIYLELLRQKLPFLTLRDIVRKNQDKKNEDFFQGITRDWQKNLDMENMRLVFIDVVSFQGAHLQVIFEENKPLFLEIMQVMEKKIKSKEYKNYDPVVIFRCFIQMLTSYLATDSIFGKFTRSKKPLEEMVAIYTRGVLNE